MRCTHCGSALGSDVAWCGLCFAPVQAAAPAQPVPAAHGAYPPPPPAYPAPPAYPYPQPDLPGYIPPGYPGYSTAAPPPPPVARLEPGAPKLGAGFTTFAAIAVGAIMQWLFGALVDNPRLENEAVIRYAIVGTLATYAVVTWLVVGRVFSDGHPLRWRGNWHVLLGTAAGLVVGGVLANRLLAMASGAGAEGGDPVANLLVSEGDFPHIAAAVLIFVVAAPVVEEVLFRGLLLAAFEHHGKVVALLVSSIAFAAWHLEVSLLVYYTLAGFILGGVYVRHGLTGSIAAHAAFNGTLLLASVAYALSPGAVIHQDGLTLRAPNGWHQADAAPEGYLHGPSGGEVMVLTFSGVLDDLDPDKIVAQVQLGTVPQLAALGTRAETARTVELPAGTAVRVQVVVDGHDGELVLLPAAEGRAYMIMLSSGGSSRVRDDFDTMLQSIQVG